MQPLTANQIHGTWAPLLLPIGEDDRIDYGRLSEELDALLVSGVNGIYSNGTAGEFFTQSEDEFDRINALLADACERTGLPFQIGATHTSPQGSLDRVQRAAELKPGAIQVILPDWVPVTSAEAAAYLERVAEAADPIGIVLYNPPHAKRQLTPQEFAELKRHVPQLVGVKVLGGDTAWYEMMRTYMANLSVFVAGHRLATGIREGASGAYSNIACLHPAGAQQWYQRMQIDLSAALELENRIVRFFTEHIGPFRGTFSTPAIDKLLAAIGGWAPIGTRLRWPYRWFPQTEAERLRTVARKMVPELFPES